jgi:hypothetical protein
VDPVPDPLLLRKSGSARNRAQTSGSVARNTDHWTTEVVIEENVIIIFGIFKYHLNFEEVILASKCILCDILDKCKKIM